MNDEHTHLPEGGPLDGRVRPLREGELMGVYMSFDRKADKKWKPAEYLLRFGAAVSAATVAVNAAPPMGLTRCLANDALLSPTGLTCDLSGPAGVRQEGLAGTSEPGTTKENMPQMNFDLEDGKPPVSFAMKADDCERFMAFMAECEAAKKAASGAVLPAKSPGFEVRVAGPDDVVRFADELQAHRNANAINQAYLDDRLKHPDDWVLCVATVHAAG